MINSSEMVFRRVVPSTVGDPDKSGWITFTVMEPRARSSTASSMGGVNTTATTERTRGCGVRTSGQTAPMKVWVTIFCLVDFAIPINWTSPFFILKGILCNCSLL